MDEVNQIGRFIVFTGAVVAIVYGIFFHKSEKEAYEKPDYLTYDDLNRGKHCHIRLKGGEPVKANLVIRSYNSPVFDGFPGAESSLRDAEEYGKRIKYVEVNNNKIDFYLQYVHIEPYRATNANLRHTSVVLNAIMEAETGDHISTLKIFDKNRKIVDSFNFSTCS